MKLLLPFLLFALAFATRGVVELDDFTFDKIVDGSKSVLVLFQEYNWKDPKDFDVVGKEFQTSPEVLIAKVDCSTSNELKDRFEIKNYPTFLFFTKGDTKNPEIYGGDEAGAAIVDFVKVQLNPKLQELKDLVVEFSSEPSKRKEIIEKATKIHNELNEDDKEYSKFFVASMKRIDEKGDDFVTKEKERLTGLIESKNTNDQKKNEFTKRLNILNTFAREVV